MLRLNYTEITDAGYDALAATLDSGALPALKELDLFGSSASAAARKKPRKRHCGSERPA